MGLTVTLDSGFPKRLGKYRMSCGTIAFDASYPTGGEAIAAADVGFPTTIDALIFVGGDAATKRLSWDKANGTVLVYLETTGTYAEQGSGTDPGLSAARFMAWGW